MLLETITKYLKDPEYVKAVHNDPEGIICAGCGELNDAWDDCGFWYQDVKQFGPYKAHCNACFGWSDFHGER